MNSVRRYIGREEKTRRGREKGRDSDNVRKIKKHTYPSILEQDVERTPFTNHVNHSRIEGVLIC